MKSIKDIGEGAFETWVEERDKNPYQYQFNKDRMHHKRTYVSYKKPTPLPVDSKERKVINPRKS